jgi:hypothetical protein
MLQKFGARARHCRPKDHGGVVKLTVYLVSDSIDGGSEQAMERKHFPTRRTGPLRSW